MNRVKRSLLVLGILALFITTSHKAMAQFGASLSGTIVDTSGAIVTSATVTISNNATKQTSTTVTGSTGAYRFSELPPGSYTLKVEAKGFKTSTDEDVQLAAETPRNVDVKLTPGGAQESVVVNSSEVPALQTTDASIGGSIDSETLQRIPTFGRDPYELLRTTVGITGDGARSGSGLGVFLPNGAGPGQSNSGIFQTENQIQISANGQRIGSNNYMIDGVSVNSLGYGGAAVVTPNEEAVSQMTVLSSSYSAEDGRNTGAQIKVVTKSGTNQIHGGGVFQYDEPGLNAYNKYGGPSGQLPTRVQNKQRNWAASIGGPVLKDKLFYFFSYEGYKSTNTSYPSQYIETSQYRALAASARPSGIAHKITGASGGVPRVRTILNVTCSSPVKITSPCAAVGGGLDLGSPYGSVGTYVPLSLASVGGGLDGVPDVDYAQLISPSNSRGNQFNGRGDWFITPHDQLAGSFYFTKLDNNGPSSATGSRPNADIPFKPLNSAGTAIYIHTFSPTLLNELRVNGTRFSENGITDSQNTVNWGIPYINIQNMPFDSNNDVNFGVSQSSTSPAIFAENTYELRDAVTKTWGAHTLKMGFEYQIQQDNNNLAGQARPVYAFAGMWNFLNDTPIYEGIIADPNTGGVPNAKRYLRSHYYGVYGQHDWKVSPNFTFNAGLRWEYFEPLYNSGSKVNYPMLGTTPGREMIDVSLLPHNHLWNSQYKNFSPKFGFAFTPPPMNGKTVIRGGFALAYNRLNDALFDPAVEDGPGYFNYGICCGTASTDFGSPYAKGQIQYSLGTSTSPYSYPANAALATGTNGNGLPKSGAAIEVYGSFPNTKTPYSYLYSLEVQNQLPWQVVVTVGYQGSTGRHWTRLVNQQFIYNNSVTSGGVTTSSPFGNGAYFAQTDSNQYYNGFNIHGQKRLSHGFTLDAIYTWSKGMDQITNGDSANANGNQTNPAHNETELGPSDYDTRHRVTVTGLWQLPKVKSGNTFVKLAANGWEINGLYTYHTGFPFTPVTYQLHGIPTVPNAYTIGPVRPLAYYGGGITGCSNSNFTSTGGIFPGGGSKYFNITAPTNGSGTTPGIGRNSFRGPCYSDIDMSFAKVASFEAVGHTVNLRFQSNFYNVFNHLNLTPFTNGNSNPASLIESATFGRAQSAGAGRVIEFVARFNF